MEETQELARALVPRRSHLRGWDCAREDTQHLGQSGDFLRPSLRTLHGFLSHRPVRVGWVVVCAGRGPGAGGRGAGGTHECGSGSYDWEREVGSRMSD